MVLGYLLARAGVPVIVLEKHADFLRDFRGDTVHPSTLEIMYELGLLASFLQKPHQEFNKFSGIVNGEEIEIADFSHLPTHCKFTALMPQWDFLNFIASQAKQYPNFQFRMESQAVGLVEESSHVAGVRVESRGEAYQISADLVVGADGRHSILRNSAKLEVVDLEAPIDVLWMRISRLPSDPEATGGRFADGQILVMINRQDYWQCAYVFAKGSSDRFRSEGLEQFQKRILDIAPFLQARVEELDNWDKIKLLTVQINRLRHWAKPGLLFIGDAAHAMSPVGGVGINLAIQDAVAAANLLYSPLQTGAPTLDQLQAVQRRREWPTKMTQRVQVFMQENILARSLETSGNHSTGLPLPLRVVQHLPILRRIAPRIFGQGFREEHVDPYLRAPVPG
jgi:2-polyprenyl-6-methoxyphenol hydroxylase-like FAD-dependent oxidoreductase